MPSSVTTQTQPVLDLSAGAAPSVTIIVLKTANSASCSRDWWLRVSGSSFSSSWSVFPPQLFCRGFSMPAFLPAGRPAGLCHSADARRRVGIMGEGKDSLRLLCLMGVLCKSCVDR